MADYREISQTYARGGILALTTINGGASVALLSQVSELHASGIGNIVVLPMVMWAAGVVAATAIWVLAFMSTRYFDVSEREPDKEEIARTKSNTYMYAGIALFILSLCLFLLGCLMLACAINVGQIPAA